jgi:hypothetical protein
MFCVMKSATATGGNIVDEKATYDQCRCAVPGNRDSELKSTITILGQHC